MRYCRCRGAAIRDAKILAKRVVIRSISRFDLYPERLIGESAYGSAEMLNRLVHEQGIKPCIPVFNKYKRTEGSFERSDSSTITGATLPTDRLLSPGGTEVLDHLTVEP
jgi:hypothetical protein